MDKKNLNKEQVDLHQAYEENPKEADELLFGRIAHSDRRGFLKGAGLGVLATAVGAAIPFHRNFPAGLVPVALAQTAGTIQGKDGLRILNDRPLNAETPAHLLDDDITPTSRHFIRNNGIPPTEVNANSWKFTIDGLVNNSLTLSINDLKTQFKVVELALQIECGGNGRSFFKPGAKGNQWSTGAVACSKWTGVLLADVLKKAGVKSNAIYTAHYSSDTHLSGTAGKLAISRGVPIEKAMSKYNLIAFQQNGKELHPMNGAPLRLVIPGWPGSCSQKWIKKVTLRDIVHDGPKMTGTAYRVPNRPVAPGEKVDTKDFEIINSMPVKSLITYPESGFSHKLSDGKLTVRGSAWAGDETVKALEVSTNFGATWKKAKLHKAVNPYAWQRWSADIQLPEAGYYEVWSRARDSKGVMQPSAIAWNPKGYLNNSIDRVAVRAV